MATTMTASAPVFVPRGVEAAFESKARPTKLFIGGLTQNTTTKQLRDHFSRYGKVLDCVAMRKNDGAPRGFGYVTLDSLVSAEACIAEQQKIDGRIVDVKRAVPGKIADARPPTTSKAQNWKWQSNNSKNNTGGYEQKWNSYTGYQPSSAWNTAWGFDNSTQAGAAALASVATTLSSAAKPSMYVPPPPGLGFDEVVVCPKMMFRFGTSEGSTCSSNCSSRSSSPVRSTGAGSSSLPESHMESSSSSSSCAGEEACHDESHD